MKRIEFVFFDAGGGHRAAASALQLAIGTQQRPWDAQLTNLQELLDDLDIMKKYAGIRIEDTYNQMLRKGWTLGSPQLMKVLQLAIRLNHPRSVRMLEKRWKESQPDMVVSFVPHFNRALRESFDRVFPGRPFVTVITDIADYPPHFWIERQQQFIVCGSAHAVEQARATGYSDENIFRASGMILHPRFYDAPWPDVSAERLALGLRPDVPTALVMFGGYGSKAMVDIAKRLDASNLNLQFVFLCGRNEPLAAALGSQRGRLPRVIKGFTTQVNRYMQLSDFFIGKPGPGSVSEALQMRLPVIVECNAWTLPQERYNAKWIVENKVGLVLPNFRTIDKAVAELIEPHALASYRANTAAMNNRAVFEIPEFFQTIFARTGQSRESFASSELESSLDARPAG